jgi:pimeloyl-ACP methyl ester carboxylesterase
MCGGYQGALPTLSELYPRIACPTLVLWGGNDRHFPPEHARLLQRVIPGAQLAVLEGAEHWMAWYRAGEIAERISAFVPPRGSA